MGIKRIVDTDFWTDDKVLDEFSIDDRLFMLYLMTNPHTTQLGIYKVNMKYMVIETGFSKDVLNVLIERFERNYGIIKYSNKTKEIAIKNYLKYSIVKGGAPVRDCLVKEIKAVKNKQLIAWVFSQLKGSEELNDTVKKIIDEYEEKNGTLNYCNEKQNENEYENDNENENDNEVSYHDSYNDSYHDSSISSSNVDNKIPYQEIVDYLNMRTGSNYKSSSKKTRDLIKARFNEGFTVDDFKTVIDKKCMEWLHDKKMNKYLRTETLFGTKFESYLNQQIVMTTRDVPIDISDF